jgi:mannose-1-phosphate guanylyltransferase
VRAVVLVGGQGTRLRPLTFTTPKPLLPVGNQVLLERQLTWLASHGVEQVALSLGYLPDAFRGRFPDHRFRDPAGREVRIAYAVEPTPLGTAGAVRFAAEHLDGAGPFVVCNGDVVTGLDLSELVAFHSDRGAEATIALARVDDPSAFGVVPTFEDGEVQAFVEKPPPDTAPTDWINAGTYVLEPAILDRIPPGLRVSIERDTFLRVLEQRGRLYAMASDAYWIDVGTPAQYLQVHADLLAGRLGRPPAPGARETAPDVWSQGEGPDPAGLTAPVLVGAGGSVAVGATVSGSVLGAGVRVGPGALITGSVVHDGVLIESGAHVDTSIVGAGAVIGTGAAVRDRSIVGAGERVDPGATLVGGQVPAATTQPAAS